MWPSTKPSIIPSIRSSRDSPLFSLISLQRHRPVEHNIQRCPLTQIDLFAPRQQHSSQAHTSADTCADARAFPATVRQTSDGGARARQNRNLFRVLSTARTLLDRILARLDLL